MSIEDKIHYWFTRTSSELIYEYAKWYYTTKEWCTDTAAEYNNNTHKIAGILSALSVQKEFSQNKRLVKEFLECQSCGHMSSALKKAKLIYNLDDEDIKPDTIMNILSGRKTRSFYHNIMYPGSSEYLTVDFRMWKYYKEDSWEHITPRRYNVMEKVFNKVALDNGISVPSLQAICWCITKYDKKSGENKY